MFFLIIIVSISLNSILSGLGKWFADKPREAGIKKGFHLMRWKPEKRLGARVGSGMFFGQGKGPVTGVSQLLGQGIGVAAGLGTGVHVLLKGPQ